MQRKLFLMLVVVMMLVLVLGVFAGSAAAAPGEKACWGQASAVFAQAGEMGLHSSSQPTPRLGLHNLAVALHEAGVIPEASMSALGMFVAGELGLSIDACGT